MSPELRNRLLIGPLMGGTAFGLIAWDIAAEVHYGSVLLGVIVALTASREYARLVRNLAPGVQTWPIVIGTLALIATVWPGAEAIGIDPQLPLGTLVISLALVWVCLSQMARHALDHFSANVATTMLGLIYIGVAMQLLAALSIYGDSAEDTTRGAKLLAVTIAACKFGDIFAFFGGRRFGRNKLAPTISPGKTWEGFGFSLIGAVAGTFVIDWLLQLVAGGPSAFGGWWQLVVWGLVVGPAGVLGDLVESCFKRTAAVKDSGGGIPGFGGFLDVFDAVLIAAPIAYGLALVL